jgi:hypothetical protein
MATTTTDQTVSQLSAPADDGSSTDGADSMIYYMKQKNRWLMMDLVQCDNHECDNLCQPMRRLSLLAIVQQQQQQQQKQLDCQQHQHPANSKEGQQKPGGLGRQSPWAKSA